MNIEASLPTQDMGLPPRCRLLGLVGSLRARSFSRALLEAIAEASPTQVQYQFAELGDLPHFNQDLYSAPLPQAVARFRSQIEDADGIVISSPEYNHGMPALLKNALEWGSRPHNASPLKGKPVLILTSSVAYTGGVRAQYQIRETLVSALARPTITPEIVVGGIDTKIVDGRFQDPVTIKFALKGLSAMFDDVVSGGFACSRHT